MKDHLLIASLLDGAGISINGSAPFDIQVHDDRFYKRVLADGTLGFGESYMEGWWDVEELDTLIAKLLRADLKEKVKNWKLIFPFLKAKLINVASKSRAKKVGEQHYDAGNDLFEKMLDKTMTYTCAYWKQAKNLDEAQIAKLDLICRKIGLKPGMKVLDIGCGWGNFAKFAAENYGAQVTGISISKEQIKLAEARCKDLNTTFLFQDYRDTYGEFDRIISICMLEHVGYKNYRTYMEVVNRCLKEDGLFLLQVIGSKVSHFDFDRWMEKYIFPNSMLPSIKQLAESVEGLFVIEDLHNFGADYDKTLIAWRDNFRAHWDELKGEYNEKFRRMWEFYLNSCAALFRVRETQLWQIVFSKNGVPGGYISIR